jgi:hypothetical protein
MKIVADDSPNKVNTSRGALEWQLTIFSRLR